MIYLSIYLSVLFFFGGPMKYHYRFPTVKGVQAKSTYYIAMVPCKLLSKLFVTETEEVSPEFRAQRRINHNRIPPLVNYVLSNRESFVFSALSASINGDFSFISTGDEMIGELEVDMSSTFLINDGQHRKTALEKAMIEDPSLGEETISIVFFEDKGLQRSQQMFTDLNKHAVNTTKSLNTLYDNSDAIAVFTKKMVKSISFFRSFTDLERDTLGKFSKMLFTLNNFYNANILMFQGLAVEGANEKRALLYWDLLSKSITEWAELTSKEITKKSLREDYIVTQGVVLLAFGKIGNEIMKDLAIDMSSTIPRLSNIDWARNNPLWEGRAIREGRIERNRKSIHLTYLAIKEMIGMPMSEQEKRLNNHRRG
jgi:DNA sulfur modification protein DndB